MALLPAQDCVAAAAALSALTSPHWTHQRSVVPTDASFRHFSGFVRTEPDGSPHLVHVAAADGVLGQDGDRDDDEVKRAVHHAAAAGDFVPRRPPLRISAASVAVAPRLAELLAPQRNLLSARLAQAGDLPTFLHELRTALDAASTTSVGAATATLGASSVEYFGALVSGLSRIGWDAVQSYHHPTRQLVIQVADDDGRAHTLTLVLPTTFPVAAPVARVHFPHPWSPTWSADASLADVVAQFKRACRQFSALWRVLDDFDQHTCVLDPDPGPSRLSVTHRRIAIGQYSWLHLDVAWMSPQAPCECRFVGSAAVVEPLQRRFAERLRLWSRQKLPRDNLEHILQTTFPAPSGDDDLAEDLDVECGMCYSYKLPADDEDGGGRAGAGAGAGAAAPTTTPDATPDLRCETPSCGRPFHSACVVEWLASLPTTRRSFGMLFGKCPYCQGPLSVPQPHSGK